MKKECWVQLLEAWTQGNYLGSKIIGDELECYFNVFTHAVTRSVKGNVQSTVRPWNCDIKSFCFLPFDANFLFSAFNVEEPPMVLLNKAPVLLFICRILRNLSTRKRLGDSSVQHFECIHKELPPNG